MHKPSLTYPEWLKLSQEYQALEKEQNIILGNMQNAEDEIDEYNRLILKMEDEFEQLSDSETIEALSSRINEYEVDIDAINKYLLVLAEESEQCAIQMYAIQKTLERFAYEDNVEYVFEYWARSEIEYTKEQLEQSGQAVLDFEGK